MSGLWQLHLGDLSESQNAERVGFEPTIELPR